MLKGKAEDEASEEENEELTRRFTKSDKRKIRKFHSNLEHPNQPNFLRALRIARARQEVLKFVKEEFKCDMGMGQNPGT